MKESIPLTTEFTTATEALDALSVLVREAREDGHADALEALEWHLVELGLQKRLSWEEVGALWHSPTVETLIVCLFKRFYTPEQCERLPRALGERGGRADPIELLVIGVHGLNCEGEDLPTVSDAVLRQRMEDAERLRQLVSPSRWMRGYVRRLSAEWDRRRGRGAA